MTVPDKLQQVIVQCELICADLRTYGNSAVDPLMKQLYLQMADTVESGNRWMKDRLLDVKARE
ncbi:hypothetical protein [Effusibacillus consociatus]|uniref:Spore coat protein n=1 Tax=Effusibacillus consociatus TaxID=1117041 RepID=A0ABV9Q339_9BACL